MAAEEDMNGATELEDKLETMGLRGLFQLSTMKLDPQECDSLTEEFIVHFDRGTKESLVRCKAVDLVPGLFSDTLNLSGNGELIECSWFGSGRKAGLMKVATPSEQALYLFLKRFIVLDSKVMEQAGGILEVDRYVYDVVSRSIQGNAFNWAELLCWGIDEAICKTGYFPEETVTKMKLLLACALRVRLTSMKNIMERRDKDVRAELAESKRVVAQVRSQLQLIEQKLVERNVDYARLKGKHKSKLGASKSKLKEMEIVMERMKSRAEVAEMELVQLKAEKQCNLTKVEALQCKVHAAEDVIMQTRCKLESQEDMLSLLNKQLEESRKKICELESFREMARAAGIKLVSASLK